MTGETPEVCSDKREEREMVLEWPTRAPVGAKNTISQITSLNERRTARRRSKTTHGHGSQHRRLVTWPDLRKQKNTAL